MPIVETGIGKALDRVLRLDIVGTAPVAPQPIPGVPEALSATLSQLFDTIATGLLGKATPPIRPSAVTIQPPPTVAQPSIPAVSGTLSALFDTIAPGLLTGVPKPTPALTAELPMPTPVPEVTVPEPVPDDATLPGNAILRWLTVVGENIERYAERPWKLLLGYTAQKLDRDKDPGDIKAMADATAAARRLGFKAMFSDDVRKLYDEWDTPRFLKGTLEFFNPVFFLPYAGIAGLAAKMTARIPVLGKTVGAFAKGAWALERLASFKRPFPAKVVPIEKPYSTIERVYYFALPTEAEQNIRNFPGTWQRGLAKVPIISKLTRLVSPKVAAQTEMEKAIVNRAEIVGGIAPAHDNVAKALLRQTLVDAGVKGDIKTLMKIDMSSGNPVVRAATVRPGAFMEITINRQILRQMGLNGIPGIVRSFGKPDSYIDLVKRAIQHVKTLNPSYLSDESSFARAFTQHFSNIAGRATLPNDPNFFRYLWVQTTNSSLVKRVKPENILGDVLEHPNLFNMPDPMRKWIDTVHKLVDDMDDILVIEGVPVDKLAFGELAHYVHRVVAGRGRLVRTGSAPTRVGRRQPFQQSREFQTALQGVQAGMQYGADPEAYLTTYIQQGFRAVADKRLVERAKNIGIQARMPSVGEAFLPDTLTSTAKGLPGLRGWALPVKEADRLERYFNDEGAQFLRKFSDVNSALRTMRATLDLSAMVIQGSMVAFYKPAAWAKAVKSSVQALWHPEIVNKFYADNAKLLSDLVEKGLYIGQHEYYEAMPILTRMWGKVPLGGKAIAKVYENFGTSFGVFGDVARVETAKALMPLAEKQGARAVSDLMSMLNNMTGVTNSAAQGIQPTQRLLESMALFSPRYTRSGFFILGNSLKGNIAGQEAREAFSHFINGGLLFYVGVCAAAGQTPNLDPSSARFMSVKIGDRWYGLGGNFYWMARMLVDTKTTVQEAADTMDWRKLVAVDSPFARRLLVKTAPLMQMVNQVGVFRALDGQDKGLVPRNFLGEGLESPEDWALWAANQFVPIAVGGLIAEKPYAWEEPETSWLRFLGEFGGLRTFPQDKWEVVTKTLNDNKHLLDISKMTPKTAVKVQKNEEILWGDLDTYNKTLILEKLPALKDKFNEAVAWSARRSNYQWRNYSSELDLVVESTAKSLQQEVETFRLSGSGIGMREAVAMTYTLTSKWYEDIRRHPDYAEVITELDALKKTKEGKQDVAVIDRAYQSYIEKIASQTFEDEYGFDFNAYKAAVEAFKKEHGEDTWNIIQRILEVRRGEPPILAYLRFAKTNVLDEYWQIHPQAIKQVRLPGKGLVTRTERELFRQVSPQVDALLYTFGYVGTVETPQARKLVADMKEKFNLEGLSLYQQPQYKLPEFEALKPAKRAELTQKADEILATYWQAPEGAKRDRVARTNPVVDAWLYLLAYRRTVSSGAAASMVEMLKKEHGIARPVAPILRS